MRYVERSEAGAVVGLRRWPVTEERPVDDPEVLAHLLDDADAWRPVHRGRCDALLARLPVENLTQLLRCGVAELPVDRAAVLDVLPLQMRGDEGQALVASILGRTPAQMPPREEALRLLARMADDQIRNRIPFFAHGVVTDRARVQAMIADLELTPDEIARHLERPREGLPVDGAAWKATLERLPAKIAARGRVYVERDAAGAITAVHAEPPEEALPDDAPDVQGYLLAQAREDGWNRIKAAAQTRLADLDYSGDKEGLRALLEPYRRRITEAASPEAVEAVSGEAVDVLAAL